MRRVFLRRTADLRLMWKKLGILKQGSPPYLMSRRIDEGKKSLSAVSRQ